MSNRRDRCRIRRAEARELQTRRSAGARQSGLRNFVSAYDCGWLLALISAGLGNPAFQQDAGALTAAFHACLASNSASRRAGEAAAVLEKLIAKTAMAVPAVHGVQDYVPLDGGLDVRADWCGKLVRLFPGASERPLRDLQRWRQAAGASDEVLDTSLGFGMSDLVAAALHINDQWMRVLSPHWVPAVADSAAAQRQISPAEVDAAALFLSAGLHLGARQMAAVQWASTGREAYDLDPEPSPGSPAVGPWLALRETGRLMPLPAALVVDGLIKAVPRLAAEAYAGDPGVERRYAAIVEEEARRHLYQLGGDVHPYMTGPGGPVLAAVSFGARHWLAVSIVTSLGSGPEQFRAQIRSRVRALRGIRPGTCLLAPGGTGIPIPDEAAVIPVLVVARPDAGLLDIPGLVIMGLDDLSWIAGRISSDPGHETSFFAFCRDLAEPGTDIIGWERANHWESWDGGGGSFHEGIRHYSGIFVDAHQTSGEWAAAAADSPLTAAFYAAGLPPLSDCLSDPYGLQCRGVAHPPSNRTWWVDPAQTFIVEVAIEEGSNVPPKDIVAIAKIAPLAAHASGETLHRLTAMLAGGSILIRLIYQPSGSRAIPLELTAMPEDGSVELTADSRIWAQEALNPGWIQARTGTALIEALRHIGEAAGIRPASLETSLSEFSGLWNAVGPVFSMEPGYPSQYGPCPATVNIPAHAQRAAEGAAAGALAAARITPGEYADGQAAEIETDIVMPALVAEIRERLRRYDRRRSIDTLAGLADRAEAVRSHRRTDRDRAFRTVIGEQARLTDYAAKEAVLLASARAADTLLELALTATYSGTDAPDQFEIGELLALADLYGKSSVMAATHRSGTWSSALRITDAMLAEAAKRDDAPYRAEEHHLQRWRHGLPEPDYRTLSIGSPELAVSPGGVGIAEPSPVGLITRADWPPEGAVEPPADRIRDSIPNLAGLDDAFTASLGFGLDALLGCLVAAADMVDGPSGRVGPLPGDFAARCCDRLLLPPPTAQISAAIDFLTLRSDSLAVGEVAPWRARKRAHRLAVKPFVRDETGTFLLPWKARAAGEIWGRYLTQGIVPIPVTSLPDQVRAALDAYRDKRNISFERDVAQVLSDADFQVLLNVKPNKAVKRLGIRIPGEIDIVAWTFSSTTIWVIEVKDLSETFAPEDAINQRNDFYAPHGYQDKLLAKTGAIRSGLTAVRQALSLPPAIIQVRPVFVIREPSIVAHLTDAAVPFLTREELAKNGLLSKDD